MESEYRTKSSVGDGDDDKLKRRRYQETLGAHVVHRESVVPKGKRIVSKGQEGSDRRKFQKRTQEWGRWNKHENDQFKTVQGTGRTSTYGPCWTQKKGGEWEWRGNGQLFSDLGWDRHVNDPIKDKADERDDKGKQLSYLKDIRMKQTKNETQRQGIIPPQNQDQRQFPPQKLSKGARKRTRAAALRDAPEHVQKGWKPYYMRTESEEEEYREKMGLTDDDSSDEE